MKLTFPAGPVKIYALILRGRNLKWCFRWKKCFRRKRKINQNEKFSKGAKTKDNENWGEYTKIYVTIENVLNKSPVHTKLSFFLCYLEHKIPYFTLILKSSKNERKRKRKVFDREQKTRFHSHPCLYYTNESGSEVIKISTFISM